MSRPPAKATVLPWPMVPPLAPEESEHYRWLVDGLIRGLRARAAMRGDEVAIRALETIFDLADELLARLDVPPMPAPGAGDDLADLAALDGFAFDGDGHVGL